MPSILEGVFSASDDELNKMLVSLVGMPKEQIEAELSALKTRVEEVAQTIPTKGNKGDKGDKGDQGIQGPKGEPGRDGRDGFIGKDGKQGVAGQDGKDGKDGVSIVDVNVAFDNHLVITLSDGTEIDAGVIGSLNENLQNVVANYVSNGANGTLIYKGLWNASTNTPLLSLSSSDAGAYYVVSVAGSTNLSGITDWQVNDWAIFNGTAWQKIDNSDLFNPSAVAITGGSINGTTIGSTTPSTGKFTSVTTPSVTASSTDLTLSAISTGALKINTNTGEMFRVADSSGTGFIQLSGGTNPYIVSQGSTNSTLSLSSNGTGTVWLRTGGGGVTQAAFAHTASAVNYVQVTGAATTKAVINSAQGSDSNISMAFQPKGTGAIDLAAGSSGVNISNGGTVTAITRTGTGSGYTTSPTGTISAPTTAGGVQATFTPYIGLLSATTAIAGGGTGYTAGDTLTVSGGTGVISAQITVSTVSGGVITGFTIPNNGNYTVLPTSPVSVTGGTGTGATFSHTGGGVITPTITNAGSGYIEQPTVSFSGGGGSGASAYATVGSQSIIKGIGASSGTISNQSIMFQTPAGNSLLLRDAGTATPDAHVMLQATANGYAYVMAEGSNANASLYVGARGTGSVRFSTSGTSIVEQLRVSHTASAVNYVQVTGSATTLPPAISVQGSDTNSALILSTKGNGSMTFRNNNSSNIMFRCDGLIAAANYLQVAGALAGSSPVLSAQGSDTNIDLSLTPKGTGLVRFGTYTAGAPTATGYISIKAADGTTYKVLVST